MPIATAKRQSARVTLVNAAAEWAEAYAENPERAFPTRAFAELHSLGLLTAALPLSAGGQGLGSCRGTHRATLKVLRSVGRGSLSAGRVFEGHVNALQLIVSYGSLDQLRWETGHARADNRDTPAHPSCGRRLDTGYFLRGAITFSEPEL